MKKRIAAALLALAMVFSFAACGASGPEVPVIAFLDGMKNWDPKSMAAATVDGSVEEDPFGSVAEDQKVIYDFFKKYAKEINYTIKETKTEGETATVTVEVKYKDTSATIQAAVGALFTEALKMAASNEKFESSDAMKLFGDCLSNAEKTTTPSDATETVTFTAKKVGNDWKLSDIPDVLVNVWLSNGMSALGSLTGN